MSDSLDNGAGAIGREQPKRLKKIAMMKLTSMITERFVPSLLLSSSNIDWVGGCDAVREETLSLSDWIYDTLCSPVADYVQKGIMKSTNFFLGEDKCHSHPHLKFLNLLLLHPKCRNLSSDWFLECMIEDVTNMLRSLISLELIEWAYPPTDKFTKNLKYCTRLKIFVCTEECNDEVIKVLSENCPLLSVLDIDFSESVTDNSAHYMENMKLLTKCYMNGTSITIEGATRIVKSCTKLYQLEMYHDICDILQSFEDAHYATQLSLRRVQLYNNLTSHHIYLLKKYCPFLSHADMNFTNQLESPNSSLIIFV